MIGLGRRPQPSPCTLTAEKGCGERFHLLVNRFFLLHPEPRTGKLKAVFFAGGFPDFDSFAEVAGGVWQPFRALSDRLLSRKIHIPLPAPSRGEPLRQSRGIALLPAGDLYPPT